MARIKKSLVGGVHQEPIKKKTTQGQGQHSRPKKGRKMLRGQGH
jgi:hypothetical protein|tara:strand:+ start:57 stop:188 length:132 start_codon:yes stop_codon:yes gene_type:complete